MLKRKNIKSHGKLSLSRYFQELKEGDKVAIVKEHSLNPAIPERIQGRTGIIVGKRGKAVIIAVMVGNLKKLHIMHPANLKKLK